MIDKTLPKTILAIGYGNLLRSDDGIGPEIAQAISRWKMPQVQALAVHQLTPELAESLAAFDIAIFVDACPGSEHQAITLEFINPSRFNPISGHTGDPRSLLSLTQALYNRVPQAWWVMVPGINFAVGDRLSSLAEHNIKTALQNIYHLIQTLRTEPCTKLE